MKKGILFFYLSVVLHFYVFLLVNNWLDPEIIALLTKPYSPSLEEVVVENIFIDNPHATQEKPLEKAKLSDVDSRSRGPVAPEPEYNMPLSQKRQVPPSFLKMAEVGSEDSNFTPETSGPLLYKPSQKPLVRMTSSGEIALESEAVDFAFYLKQIQQRVASNWQIYFPIFQYYRGVLPDGVVTVTFSIDNEGNLKNVRLTRDFGYESLNEASLRAVQHTSNYGPLPDALRSPEGITIEFHFIYIRP